MDIAATKLEIMQQLLSIMDEKTLRKVASFFKKEVPAASDEDDFTAEDIVELDRRRAEYLRGEGTSYTVEESLQRLRSGKR
jgi:hypothetical protein